MKYGAVVRVFELDRMRAFYRDVLQLGSPVVDSNFWVEFRLPGDGLLALEQSNSAKPPESVPGRETVRVSWLLPVKDFDATVAALADRGVKQIRPPIDVPGRKAATFADPEGNPFTIYSGSSAPSAISSSVTDTSV